MSERGPQARSSTPRRLVAGALAQLPTGAPLPGAVWRVRHRALLAAAAVLDAVALAGAVLEPPPAAAAVPACGVVLVLVAVLALGVAALPWHALPQGAPARARLTEERSRVLRSCAASVAVVGGAAWLVAVSPGEAAAQVVLVVAGPLAALYCSWPAFLAASGAVLVHRVALGALAPAAGSWASTGLQLLLALAVAALAVLLWRTSERTRLAAALVVEHLGHAVRHDGLTGLLNRAGLAEEVDRALLPAPTGAAGAAGGPGRLSRPLAVVVVDLDRFREVNDTLGHTAGDELLRTVASTLVPLVAESAGAGVLARLGGDEFALLLPGLDAGAGLAVADLLRRRLREGVEVAGILLDLDLSAGVSEHLGGEDLDDAGLARAAEELLRHADIAMYAAKSAGGGARAYDAAHDHHSTARLEVARELRLAVDRDDELVLHFQPKVALGGGADGRLVGVEALVRWVHPVRGVMSPGEFIPVMESTDLVHPFTAKVLHLALAQARTWADAGHWVPVAVNVPPRCLVHPGFVAQVALALGEHGLPPALLRVEITEDALVADPVAASRVITELRGLGVPTAIDDFGTGYSSLSYLRKLPVDEVKLDRSFITGLGRPAAADERAAAAADEVLVASITDLAHRLGMTVVAEGVEEEHEASALRELGADVAQGYLFGRPVPAQDVAPALLATTAPPAVPRPRGRHRAADAPSDDLVAVLLGDLPA